MFASSHIGHFWSKVHAEYPRTEDALPLMSDVQSPLPPLRRAFFITESGRALLQLGANHFHANWRRLEDSDEYPRFGDTFQRFSIGLDLLSQYAQAQQLPGIQPQQFELTYTNQIFEQPGEMFPVDAPKYLRFGQVPALTSHVYFSGPPSRAVAAFVLPLASDQGTLEISAQHGVRNTDHKRLILLQFAAISGNSPGDRNEWFSLAHRAIVGAFAELTTQHAHQLWGKAL
jgi:uncharacterized protein (TIGR04255 family)